MADYIYLLENRLSTAQKEALSTLRDLVRARGLTLFLVGGAVRDLTSGSPVRDLDVAVQGNALKLRKDLESAGAVLAGSNDPGQALYLRFPGGVRVELGSTLSAHHPKPGKPVFKPGTILEDLRRRDFTANAMALSLNEGSYGLLMDPLNGVADIENRELRLVSNYGFIEEPVRLIRAARFAARLGWTLEEKTQTRYETGKQEGYITSLQDFHRGYEAEEIVHEEDPLRVMRRLEAEGWMQALAPAWNSSKANLAELDKVRESQTQLQLQGVHPDAAAVNFPLLTAKMAAKDVEALKKSFPRPGFVGQIEALEGEAKDLAAQLGAKAAATPSASYRLIHGAKPEAVLYVAYTTRNNALQAKFKSFFTEWPLVRQKIPLTTMAEMRITPELPGYQDLVEKLFFELMDGHLSTAEEMRAFLEPFSPPAPPPPVNVRRLRAAKKDAKKGRLKKGAASISDDADDDELEDAAADLDPDEDAEDEVEALEPMPNFASDVAPGHAAAGEDDEDDFEDEPEQKAAPVKKAERPLAPDSRRPAAPKLSKVEPKDGGSAARAPRPAAIEKQPESTLIPAIPRSKGAAAKKAETPAQAPAKAVVAAAPKPEPARSKAAKAAPAKPLATKATSVKVVAVKPPIKAIPDKSVKAAAPVPSGKAAANASKAPAKRSR